MKTDADYRENQRQAQRKWQANHPDYWKEWRQRHPAYVARNRQQQQKRNRSSATQTSIPTRSIAKMDVWDSEISDLTGTYEICVPNREDCKDGRVNANNHWIINRIEDPP